MVICVIMFRFFLYFGSCFLRFINNCFDELIKVVIELFICVGVDWFCNKLIIC